MLSSTSSSSRRSSKMPFSALFVLCFNFLLLPIAIHSKEACDSAQFTETPCRCCKMDCWYSVAGSATHQLGHIPGEAGEREALATLRLIRACMIAECTPLCVQNLMRKRTQGHRSMARS